MSKVKKKQPSSGLSRGLKNIHQMVPGMMPTTVLSSAVTATFPFINIYFSAMILNVLSGNRDVSSLVKLVIMAVVLNFVLFVMKEVLERRKVLLRDLLYSMETGNVNKKLFTVDYAILESTQFQEKVKNYKEANNEVGNPLYMIVTLLGEWTKGICSILWAGVLLYPMFKVSLGRFGEPFIRSPWFLFAVAAAVIIAVVIILLVSQQMNKKWNKLSNRYIKLSRILGFYLDMVANYSTGKEIRIYKEQDIIKNHATDELLGKGRKIQEKIAGLSGRATALIAVIGAIVGCGVYMFIGLKGLLGLFGVGSLVQYMGSFMQIVQGLVALAGSIGQLSMVLPNLGYYFTILDTQNTQRSGNRKLEDAREEYEIEFRNVSFRYPGSNKYALKNISVTISAHEKIAIVGQNGSGKTTFIKLLCRLYDVDEGQILINGINIKEYAIEEYRALFSVVFQDFKIFSLPLGENVSASVDYDEQEVKKCLLEAGIKQRVDKMPEGLNTYLYQNCNENGIEISGGEAQKIAFARALYNQKSPIIILDEPTAALDPIAESDLYLNFNKLVDEKTAIFISHRLSSCLFCSKIAVFDNGSLIQYGTHQELVQSENSKYYELWTAQSKYYLEA